MWFFLTKNSGQVLRGDYFRFKTKLLEPFHIPIPSKEIEEKLYNNVKILLLNIEFYLKYSKFENRVLGYFGDHKVSKKLREFYYLSFNEFLVEVNKVSNVHLSLKEKDEWEDFFKIYKEDLRMLKLEISKADSMLHELVFDLYNLEQQERTTNYIQ